ncbi:bifunctional 2-polyprenyl-6-hydroxyphenol methylase/3-demethylubiquinol 3-O-methyltransferase UbiG [Sphingomonas rubra]|uniref:Ubiquinone biosynthesis O-methyltransferase n=1 Tax=Sphingomonas rubra TaxID=634430 RepID=A0A1I5T4B4_9SPHN|nr:bifunctional 2-polyprenyl-6-hydroxyphenol methylase/3-demethylubiquinol 3-O-methyltransferase UbiG [Sphingomonas rubra]SFP77853.1 3-demethylubiquinone-9 3-methyltransferase [Sphingomonas rubra]
MTLTSTPDRPTTIVAAEAAHFGKMAADWWDPKGSSAMLHRLNPVRLRYIRAAVDAHWGADAAGFAPLAGRRALDVGCGAGLLAEPLARLGAAVTGLDAAPENAAAAAAHAQAGGLSIDYRAGSVEDLDGERFDLVTCLEVIEHVGDRGAFVRGLAEAVAPGGMLILSTPNRTALSRLALVGAAEATGLIPRGTHDWERFLTPEELTVLLASEGLGVRDVTGIAFSPATGFTLGPSLALDYILTAVPA